MRKLAVSDISDLRAYERERDDFRARIIAMKKRRRIALGDVITLVFENRDTMRFQIQEMARAEKMISDEQITREVATYNELVPDSGELSATLLVELTSEAALREWLPKLVGIEREVAIELGGRGRGEVVGEPIDEDRLTRQDVTAAVHFLRFTFGAHEVDALVRGPVSLVSRHPDYPAETALSIEQHAELVADLTE